jgi:hypothetical protein
MTIECIVVRGNGNFKNNDRVVFYSDGTVEYPGGKIQSANVEAELQGVQFSLVPKKQRYSGSRMM